MFRTIFIFIGLIVALGCGVGIAAWPRGAATPERGGLASAQQMKAAYGRIRPGVTPVSQLAGLGLDVTTAGKLSYLGVIEHFMPRDSFGFDALDPAVKRCFEARDRCTAYVFRPHGDARAQMLLLVEGGRVAYKAISGVSRVLAERHTGARVAVE